LSATISIPTCSEFIRDIRHNKIGANRFVLVTTLIAGDHFDAVKHAMQAGTDDIIVKPVKEDQLLQRLKRVTVNRQAFVVTSDYLGTDRRGKSRPSSIERIDVLNTMLEKASCKDITTEEVKSAVDGSMNQVFHARLDSHGYRLGFVCNLLINAYDNNNIDQSVQENLRVLVDVLRDAAKTAERVNEKELGLLCGFLSKEVEGIAERYMTPSLKDLALIRKLTRAVLLALKPNMSPDQLEKETKAAAQNHLQRQREAFGKSAEIQRSPEDTEVETVDEPIIEILPLNKGQTLFKQGEAATSAYILVSGVIGIYRDIDGQSIPVARVKKGEFFGEMAIIDGTPRRATAIALEPSTVSIVAKDMIEDKMNKADVSTRFIINMLISSLRKVPEKYAAKSRQVSDTVREMREQVDVVHGFAQSPSAPAEAKAILAGPAAKLTATAKDIAKLVDSLTAAERRSAALPPATPPVSPAAANPR